MNMAGGGAMGVREFPVAADQRVWAVFAETLAHMADRAEVQLAARHERYDKAGSSTDPIVAARFLVNDLVSLRGPGGRPSYCRIWCTGGLSRAACLC